MPQWNERSWKAFSMELERADSSEAWRESMMWDCLFLGRLLTNIELMGQIIVVLSNSKIRGDNYDEIFTSVELCSIALLSAYSSSLVAATIPTDGSTLKLKPELLEEPYSKDDHYFTKALVYSLGIQP